ncbi:hypothetical protein MtrunA17_Chr1g0201181 [Medicago truncatula]|uniref:Uncharacterized protein n=1 Tax=Medicago truncatula TaxID=3880 RepID=A0A396JZN8_MEDTR|nr:hypothetical protein MtrunA17_Chr1g0201181 [Medicago truncatula]
MKEYGVVESWTKFMIIPHEKLIRNYPSFVDPLFVSKDGVVLLLNIRCNQLVLYNSNTGQLDHILITTVLGRRLHIYHESLMSPRCKKLMVELKAVLFCRNSINVCSDVFILDVIPQQWMILSFDMEKVLLSDFSYEKSNGTYQMVMKLVLFALAICFVEAHQFFVIRSDACFVVRVDTIFSFGFP